MSNEKRLPDWTMCVKVRDDKWEEVGAAWETAKGHLFIKLNEGAVLEQGEDYVYMMFPYRPKPQGTRQYATGQRRGTWQPPQRPARTVAQRQAEYDDYMERKRSERRQGGDEPTPAPVKQPPPKATCQPEQAPAVEPDTGPDEPDWL